MGKKKNKKQLIQSASLTDDDIQQKAIYDWSIYRNTHVGASHKEYIKSRINHYQQIRDNAQQKLQKAQSVQNNQSTDKQTPQAVVSVAQAAQATQATKQSVQSSNNVKPASQLVQPAQNEQAQPRQITQTSKPAASASQKQLIGKDESGKTTELTDKDKETQQPNNDHPTAQKDDKNKNEAELNSKQSTELKNTTQGNSDQINKTIHKPAKKANKVSKKPSKKRQNDVKATPNKSNIYQTIINDAINDAEKAKLIEQNKKPQTIRMPNHTLFNCVQFDVQKALWPERERFKKEYNLDFSAEVFTPKSPNVGTYLAIFIGGNLPKLSKEQLGVETGVYEAIQVYRRYKLTAQGEIQNKRYNHLYSNQLNLRDTVDAIFYLLAWYAGNTRFQFSDTPDSSMGPSKNQLENFDVMTNQTSMLAKTIKNEIVEYNRAQQNDKYRQH